MSQKSNSDQGSERLLQIKKAALRFKEQRKGIEVRKATKVAGKRIGGAQRAEQARQQKRRDTKH
jgi:hypothetical protein